MQEMHNLLTNCLKIASCLISFHFIEADKILFSAEASQDFSCADLHSVWDSYVTFNKDSNTLTVRVFQYKWIYFLKIVSLFCKGKTHSLN